MSNDDTIIMLDWDEYKDLVEKLSRANSRAEAAEAALAKAREALTVLEKQIKGEDWENAAHELLWNDGKEDLFYKLAAGARQQANARRAALEPEEKK